MCVQRDNPLQEYLCPDTGVEPLRSEADRAKHDIRGAADFRTNRRSRRNNFDYLSWWPVLRR